MQPLKHPPVARTPREARGLQKALRFVQQVLEQQGLCALPAASLMLRAQMKAARWQR